MTLLLVPLLQTIDQQILLTPSLLHYHFYAFFCSFLTLNNSVSREPNITPNNRPSKGRTRGTVPVPHTPYLKIAMNIYILTSYIYLELSGNFGLPYGDITTKQIHIATHHNQSRRGANPSAIGDTITYIFRIALSTRKLKNM